MLGSAYHPDILNLLFQCAFAKTICAQKNYFGIHLGVTGTKMQMESIRGFTKINMMNKMDQRSIVKTTRKVGSDICP